MEPCKRRYRYRLDRFRSIRLTIQAKTKESLQKLSLQQLHLLEVERPVLQLCSPLFHPLEANGVRVLELQDLFLTHLQKDQDLVLVRFQSNAIDLKGSIRNGQRVCDRASQTILAVWSLKTLTEDWNMSLDSCSD
eukprot:5833677-Amphidinium_carterae.1